MRKIRAPTNPELAIGAINEDLQIILNQALISELVITSTYLNQEIETQKNDIAQRIEKYAHNLTDTVGKKCLLVDDGVATGHTAMSAVASLINAGASVTFATPVCSSSAFETLSKHCQVISLITSSQLGAIGAYYDDFSQTSDQRVKNILQDCDQYSQ